MAETFIAGTAAASAAVRAGFETGVRRQQPGFEVVVDAGPEFAGHVCFRCDGGGACEVYPLTGFWKR